MGRTHLRRRLTVVAVTMTAGLAAWAFAAGSGGGAPVPVVWRDHVVETTTPPVP